MSELILGDCLEVMAGMAEASVDAIVTDPPYGLGFMGKHWDSLPPGPETAAAMLRVLKSAHYLLAFGGTRTHHRLMCALEDAGFEIRDTLMWLYGSGFPKGKGQLKPAWEPIILCRKPGGKVRELGIDECRIGTTDGGSRVHGGVVYEGVHDGYKRPGASCLTHKTDWEMRPSGRWPANLILDETSAAMLDEQSGESKSTGGRIGNASGAYSALGSTGWSGEHSKGDPGFGDSGGASRFFYCAKASRAERNAGCEGMEARPVTEADKWAAKDRRSGTERNPVEWQNQSQNHHPTVKPVALMRWLVKLVCPESGTVLDPFMGSGSTGVACAMEGRGFVGIEREAEYLDIANARIKHAEVDCQAALEGFAEVG